MPNTNLNQPPYYDDTVIEANQQYTRVLFKPGLCVQTRELNVLQGLLQTQIQRFGDNILSSGTILSGCNFQFFNPYPFVTINDTDISGFNIIPANFVGFLAVSANSGLTAYIGNSRDGLQSTPPNLKTVFVQYRSGGSAGNVTAFTPGETLTITDANTGIWQVNINNAGLSFTNTNSVVFTPALIVNVTSGTFSIGQYISQPSTSANLQITNVGSTSSGQTVLTLKPRAVDLSAAVTNVMNWAVANNDSIFNSINTAVGTVVSIVGSGAAAGVITDGAGRIVNLPVTSRGFGYTLLPTVTVASSNNASGVAAVSLAAQNFNTQIICNTVGNGYAFGISEGFIYQNGYFLEALPQTIVVDPYDQTPNAIGVGFSSVENIITSSIDSNLLDNANGFNNFTAPGADRLQIVPTLITGSTTANSTYLPIVAWSEGNAYKIQQTTEYSVIGDEMARRTFDTSGNFVVDRFLVTTRSPSNSQFEGNTFTIAVDPGEAYIGGYRVQTDRIYTIDVAKGLDTNVRANTNVVLSYGAYVRVNQLGGIFQFSTADVVNFYDTAKGFASNSSLVSTANVVPQGNLIGNASMKMMMTESGLPGDANCIYQIYLFGMQMANGKSFTQVRSLAYGANAGIADVVIEQNPTTSANQAVLHGISNSCMIFDLGGDGIRNVNSVNYVYRTIDQTLSVSNSGIITKSIAGNPGETFSANAILSASDLASLVVVPTGGNLTAASNNNGTVTVNTTSAIMTGAGTNFITDLVAGDWIFLSHGSNTAVKKVVSVSNTIQAVLDSNASFADTVAYFRMFPKNIPAPFGTRSGLTGNTNVSDNLLTLNFGMNFSGSVTVNCAVVCSINKSVSSAGAKTADRNRMVLLDLANNVAGANGPWTLGTADVIRLDHVYVGNSSVNTSFSDVVSDFYINSQEQGANRVGLAQLVLKPRAATQLTASNWILAVFDALTTSATGVMDVVSYIGSNAAQVAIIDSQPVSNLGSSVSSYEIPYVPGRGEGWWDLSCSVDFRPIAANTCTPSLTVGAAPINPVNTISYGNTSNPANDKKFPIPGSTLSATVEYYAGRTDSVFAGQDGNIIIIKGTPNRNSNQRPPPPLPPHEYVIRLNDIVVPSYPTLPTKMSPSLLGVVMTRCAVTGLGTPVLLGKRAKASLSDNTIDLDQPLRYTQEQFGEFDRRISALEYYASLSALQTDMANQVIPSSINPTTNRFKFGFFVDPFNSYLSSNTADAQYAAFITAGTLYPALFAWSANAALSATLSMPWTDTVLVDQTFVTTAPPPPTVITPPPAYNGTISVLDYDYSVTHSPYVGVNNPTITSLPVGGWTGAIVGCFASGLVPNTIYDFYWNGHIRNDIVVLPGQGLQGANIVNAVVHGTSPVKTDANGQCYFGAYFSSTTQEFSDILETFFQAEIDYGFTTTQVANSQWPEYSANFSNVYALANIAVQSLSGSRWDQVQTNDIPGYGWVVIGITPTLKYNTLMLVANTANTSNAYTVAPIWTTGKLTRFSS